MPRVSVVIPAFNAERHLEAAVHSAVRQTFSDFEIIIVNDGSNDSTQAIADSLSVQDPRVRVIHMANGGVERARNTGIDAADSDYVAFLDADDLWEPGKLARQVSFLNEDRNVTASSTYGFYTGDGHNRLGVLEIGPTSHEHLQRRRDERKPVWLLTPSVVCRRSVLEEHGGFDESFHGAAEDLDLWTRIAERYDVLTIPEHLVAVRISVASASMLKHIQIQENTLRVRLNARRRATGCAAAGPGEFRQWLTEHAAEVEATWLPAWRSSFYYRQAGHHFLQREYARGFIDLARSSLASPRHVARKLRRQILPSMFRGGV